MRDTVIRLDVLEELDLEDCVEISGVGVSVRRGRVTLARQVPTPVARAAAERAAWKVRGVHDVVNELGVYPTSRPWDEDIARRAVLLLEREVEPSGVLSIEVQDGWILLTGRVASQAAKVTAQSALSSLLGVAGIANLVEV